jgi:hypothetical protein
MSMVCKDVKVVVILWDDEDEAQLTNEGSWVFWWDLHHSSLLCGM